MGIAKATVFYDTYVNKLNTGPFGFETEMQSSKTSTYCIVQANIPRLVDVTISSAKLRLYCLISDRDKCAYAKLYDVPEKLSQRLKYDDFAKYADKEVLVSSNKFWFTGSSESYNEWIEIDITNLIVGNLGKENFTLSINTEYGQHYAAFSTIEGGHPAEVVINYTDSTPLQPTTIYPVGDILENSGTVRFEWIYNAGNSAGQDKYELGWKMQSETIWNSITTKSTEQHYSMDASGFSNGVVEWRIKTFNAKGLGSEYATAQFFVVGKPPNPEISMIKNNAITMIKWEAMKSEEVAAQIQIKGNGTIIYDSEKIAGGRDDTHIPNMILSDGTYVALLRISNLYDMWSDWVSRVFNISGIKPEKPVIKAINQGDYIKIEITGIANMFYIYRSDGGGFIPIHKTANNVYDDFEIISGKNYKYFVRAHNESYVDSNISEASVKYRGFFISPTGSMKKRVMIYRSMDEYLQISTRTENTSSLVNYCGRTYPVKESGEFKTETLSLEGFLKGKDEKLLDEIISTNEVMCIRNKDRVFYCDIKGISKTKEGILNGYTVNIQAERVNYEEAVRFDV